MAVGDFVFLVVGPGCSTHEAAGVVVRGAGKGSGQSVWTARVFWRADV